MRDNLPATFNRELFEQVCDLLTEGKSVEEAIKIVNDINCLDEPLKLRTWRHWLEVSPDAVSEYARASTLGVDTLVGRMLGIPDTVPDVQRARLMCDNIKWYASKIAANRYGDRLDVNVNQTISIEQALTEARNRATLQRPMRDQLQYEDVQGAEYTTDLPIPTTDTQSETPHDDIDSLLE